MPSKTKTQQNQKARGTANVLNAMYEAQYEQFQAATMLAIGITMKKLGLPAIDIEPGDVELLVQGEKLDVRKLPNGGIQYVFLAPAKAE